MPVLYAMPAGFGLPTLSSFALKAMILLDLAGVDYAIETVVNPHRMPLGRVPVLRTDAGEIIAESDRVRRHVEAMTRHDFDAGHDSRGRAALRGLQALAEGPLYEALVMDRWAGPQLWPEMRAAAFAPVPAPARPLVQQIARRMVLNAMRRRDTAALPEELRLERAADAQTALQDWLGDRPFLGGDRPAGADAAVGAVIASIAAAPVETPLTATLDRHPALGAYGERVLGLLRR